jgi:hypothetical protein
MTARMSETKPSVSHQLYERGEHERNAAHAVRLAARETGLPAFRFPAASPWTVADALAFDPPEPAAAN